MKTKKLPKSRRDGLRERHFTEWRFSLFVCVERHVSGNSMREMREKGGYVQVCFGWKPAVGRLQKIQNERKRKKREGEREREGYTQAILTE